METLSLLVYKDQWHVATITLSSGHLSVDAVSDAIKREVEAIVLKPIRGESGGMVGNTVGGGVIWRQPGTEGHLLDVVRELVFAGFGAEFDETEEDEQAATTATA